MSPDESFDEAPNLDEILGRPLSRRAWLIRWGAVALTVVIIVAFALALYGPRLAAVAHPPQATYALYVTSNVTWGAIILTQDGHQMNPQTRHEPPTPVYSVPGSPPFIRLTTASTPSHITLSITAAPFTTKRCGLTIPPVHGDTCLGLNGEDVQTMGRAFSTRNAIPLNVNFSFTLNDLAPGRRGDILASIDQALQTPLPPVAVVPGSHYATGDLLSKTVMVASMPLVATLITTRDTAADGACSLICAPIAFSAPYAGKLEVWHVLINVRQTWRYTQADTGAIIGDTYENLITPIHFDLVYDPTTQAWQTPAADQSLTPPTAAALHTLCEDGRGYLDELSFQTLLTQAHLSADATSNDHGVNGCLLHVAALGQSNVGADFLWRLGVLYAVNDVARHVNMLVPVVSAQDLATFAG